MKIIDTSLLNETSERAKQSPRLRMNYNFHDSLAAPVNRLLNAMEPDTYLRPHRHLTPPKEEIFLILRGKAILFIFDNQGGISKTITLSPQEGTYGAELEPGIWHGLLVIEPNTVIYEVKEGPFTPLSADDLAPWSPEATNTETAKAYMEHLHNYLAINI